MAAVMADVLESEPARAGDSVGIDSGLAGYRLFPTWPLMWSTALEIRKIQVGCQDHRNAQTMLRSEFKVTCWIWLRGVPGLSCIDPTRSAPCRPI